MEVLQRTANRGSISDGGYDIDNSVKFEDANDEYLTRTNASGTNDKTFTVSLWCKRTKLGTTQELWDGGVYSEGTRIGFGLNSDEIWLDIGKSTKYRSTTTAQFRDTSAWYHIVWKVDTTQSTEADRFRVYVNGTEITDWASRQYPTQNFETSVASGLLARIGSYDATYHGFCGYMAEFNYLDGLAVAPTEFGEYDDDTGIWIPKEYTGSYPGQSAYLDFKDGANLGANAKGDDTDWTEVNLAAADQSTDTPTNNFCTLNLQQPNYANTGGATEGGTFMNVSGVNQFYAYYGTQGFTKGKWYWESYIVSRSGSYGLTNEMGVHTMENIILTDPYYANAFKTSYYLNFHYGYTYAWDSGTKGSKNSEDGVPDLGSSSVGKWVGLAFNADDGKATWYLDGSQMGNANLDIYDLHDKMQDGLFGVPFFQVYDNDLKVNFGGYSSQAISSGNTDANGYGNFEYAPPSGYYAICTKNLAEFG